MPRLKNSLSDSGKRNRYILSASENSLSVCRDQMRCRTASFFRMCFLSSQCLSRYIFSRNTVQTAFHAFFIRPPARSAGASSFFPVQPRAAAESRPAPDMTVSASGIIVTYIQTNCQRYFGLLNKKTARPCMIMPSDNISALFAPLSLRGLTPRYGILPKPPILSFRNEKISPRAPAPP